MALGGCCGTCKQFVWIFLIFFFSHLPGFCQLAASNNKRGPAPFPFPHDYSLKHQAGPGLPSVVLDCTKYPTVGGWKTGLLPLLLLNLACFNSVKPYSGTATSYFLIKAPNGKPYRWPRSRRKRDGRKRPWKTWPKFLSAIRYQQLVSSVTLQNSKTCG